MRVIIACKAPDAPAMYYAGRDRDVVKWVPKPELAWDFERETTATAIRDRDAKLAGCEVMVVR